VKEWDLVIEAEGRKVTTVDAFFSILRRKNPNDQFSIGILEPGVATKRDVTITLGLMESSWR
jgi:S1-C subfamily serine protease